MFRGKNEKPGVTFNLDWHNGIVCCFQTPARLSKGKIGFVKFVMIIVTENEFGESVSIGFNYGKEMKE